MGKISGPLVLASGSPRRAQLLENVGVAFEVVVPQIEEGGWPSNADFGAFAQEIALKKSRSVSLDRPGRVVVGADTVVVCDCELLGKPRDEVEARLMLEKLSGRDHFVITGVALCRNGDGEVESIAECERTTVSFKRLVKEEINAYVATGEPFDKAGGYGIQGKGAFLIEGIVGCYFNVVGLPLSCLYGMLRRWGLELLG
jgi:septum formation protein